jgi:hypothetical protein
MNPNFLESVAQAYFCLLAENFPVMCSNDEFYFLPRVDKAVCLQDRLDCLEEAKIKEMLGKVNKMAADLEKKSQRADLDIENRVDLEMLCSSMRTFLREFGRLVIYTKEPDLYLKIILFGLYGLLLKKAPEGLMAKRIEKIPWLIRQAEVNLKDFSFFSAEVSLEAVPEALSLFKSITRRYARLRRPLKKAWDSLEDFVRFVKSRPAQGGFRKERETLGSVLKETYCLDLEPEDVIEIAEAEFKATLKEIKNIAKKINAYKDWREILNEKPLEVKTQKGLLGLYRRTVKSLRSFLKDRDMLSLPPEGALRIQRTPSYLRPFRSSASYSSLARENRGLFYVRFWTNSRRLSSPDEVHKEYLFIAAHETYPGHHLLDQTRKRLSFIRRQIESPLFYEGWASYGEQLMDESGFVNNPFDRLIGKKRQLWRALRAILDIRLHTGELDFQQARRKLVNLGYSPLVAESQARHFAATCGYQLSYTLGKHLIVYLRDKFIPALGLRAFHDSLLESGQAPFIWIEKRLQEKVKRCKTS